MDGDPVEFIIEIKRGGAKTSVDLSRSFHPFPRNGTRRETSVSFHIAIQRGMENSVFVNRYTVFRTEEKGGGGGEEKNARRICAGLCTSEGTPIAQSTVSLTAWLGSISDNQKPNTINEAGCNPEWVEEEYERGNHCGGEGRRSAKRKEGKRVGCLRSSFFSFHRL